MINKVKELREKNNISQYKLAELANLTQSQISKIETGKREIKVDEAVVLSEIFSVTVRELFS